MTVPTDLEKAFIFFMRCFRVILVAEYVGGISYLAMESFTKVRIAFFFKKAILLTLRHLSKITFSSFRVV
jgi:hypothetical protein